MKVLMINGSPHANGNTALALAEMKKIFDQEGIETEILHIGNKADGAVNGGAYAPFILTVDWLGWLC